MGEDGTGLGRGVREGIKRPSGLERLVSASSAPVPDLSALDRAVRAGIKRGREGRLVIVAPELLERPGFREAARRAGFGHADPARCPCGARMVEHE